MVEVIADSVLEDMESTTPDAMLELFSVDLSGQGGGVFYFAPVAVDGAAPSFGGQVYSVVPCQASGFEWTGNGPMPQPSLEFAIARLDGDVASATAILLALLEQYDDLLDARVTRLETQRKHLDDGLDPDGAKHLGLEIFTIEQKTNQTPDSVEFRLTASVDMEDVVYPRRSAMNRCTAVYRIAAGGGGFDYTNATCPYVGAARFDIAGDPVFTDAEDRAGKDLNCCKTRFGEFATLPFHGFPAIGKIKLTQ